MDIPGNETIIAPSIFHLAHTIFITSRMTKEYGKRISRTILMYLQIPNTIFTGLYVLFCLLY